MGSICSNAPTNKPISNAPHVQIIEKDKPHEKRRVQVKVPTKPPEHPPVAEVEENKSKDINLPKNFQCDKGHDLLWHTNISFKYDSINSTWFIRCDSCSNTYTGSGYHCSDCNYNLCDICSKAFSKQREVLFCKSSHELIWCPELIFKRETDTEQGLFKCDLCLKQKREPCWTCELCDYDVCLMCSQQAGVAFPEPFIVCHENNHPLDYLEKFEAEGEPVESKCNLCLNVISDEYPRLTCKRHDFDVCMDCVNKRLKEMVPHPGFKCKCGEEKRLRIQKRSQAVEESGDEYSCMVCGSKEFNFAYLCEDCLCCYCLNCSGNIHRKILNCHLKTCDSGHRLMWRNCSLRESKTFNCEGCKTKKDTGVFLCVDCNYNLCITCFKSE